MDNYKVKSERVQQSPLDHAEPNVTYKHDSRDFTVFVPLDFAKELNQEGGLEFLVPQKLLPLLDAIPDDGTISRVRLLRGGPDEEPSFRGDYSQEIELFAVRTAGDALRNLIGGWALHYGALHPMIPYSVALAAELYSLKMPSLFARTTAEVLTADEVHVEQLIREKPALIWSVIRGLSGSTERVNSTKHRAEFERRLNTFGRQSRELAIAELEVACLNATTHDTAAALLFLSDENLEFHSDLIQRIDLARAPIDPKELQRLSKLRRLSAVTLNGIDLAAGYGVLADLPLLFTLNLAGTRFPDAAVTVLKNQTELETLDLRDTGLQNSSLLVLSTLPRLRYLDVRGTFITPEAVAVSALSRRGCTVLTGESPH